MVSGDLVGVNKSTISRIVALVTEVLIPHLKDLIKFPTDDNELLKIKSEFAKTRGSPGVLGAIDCTHIPIKSPGEPNAELSRNRKGWFSINVQAVCTASLKFSNVVARWHGSCHDSTILTNSRLWAQLQTGEIKRGYLLGDRGYACSQHLLTPVINPEDPAKVLYNKSHIQT
ncbi:putative nuclease HARBI1 [Nilaparvata lugens]|uniref:putative nuclease HARBI1 n=1 Tax=Nilaparvata lugens TaxID=108931 RepID=UPI00193E4F70|nr:putative nuclease HARBI1 [Nilaparvata lugens]